MRHWQVTATFPGGGKTTFGIQAADKSVAVKVAGRRLVMFRGQPSSVEITPIPPCSER